MKSRLLLTVHFIPISVSSRCPWLSRICILFPSSRLRISDTYQPVSSSFVRGLARNAFVRHRPLAIRKQSPSTNSLARLFSLSTPLSPFDLQSRLPSLPTFGSVFSALLSGTAPLHARHRRGQRWPPQPTRVAGMYANRFTPMSSTSTNYPSKYVLNHLGKSEFAMMALEGEE